MTHYYKVEQLNLLNQTPFLRVCPQQQSGDTSRWVKRKKNPFDSWCLSPLLCCCSESVNNNTTASMLSSVSWFMFRLRRFWLLMAAPWTVTATVTVWRSSTDWNNAAVYYSRCVNGCKQNRKRNEVVNNICTFTLIQALISGHIYSLGHFRTYFGRFVLVYIAYLMRSKLIFLHSQITLVVHEWHTL